MKHIRVLILLLVAPLLFGACSDSGTGPGSDKKKEEGAFYVRADLSGSYTGKFDATGSLTYDPKAKTAALGFWETDSTGVALIVMGLEMTGKTANDPAGRSLSLIFMNPKAGTYGSDQFCLDDEIADGASCALVAFTVKDGTMEAASIMTSGTVKITTLTDERIAGTFEGSGTTWIDGEKTTSSIQMQGGKFDVPIFDIDDSSASLHADLKPAAYRGGRLSPRIP